MARARGPGGPRSPPPKSSSRAMQYRGGPPPATGHQSSRMHGRPSPAPAAMRSVDKYRDEKVRFLDNVSLSARQKLYEK